MGILDWLKPLPSLDPALLARIEHAVDRVDPRLRQVGGYPHRLAAAVSYALDYCEGIAQRIPGPFEISRAAFAADPMVHALFASADDIGSMLATSQCVREHALELTQATGQCCALLGMRHREKAGFGVAFSHGVVRTEVPQKALYFSDHTLAEPSPDATAARQRLRDVLFDGLLKGFAAHIADVRAEHADLHREQATVHAVMRGGSDPETHTRRLEALEAQLRTRRDALEPIRLIDTVAGMLAAPEPHLRLDPVSINVDRNGVITGPDGEAGGDTLHFAELTTRDMRRWVVVLARIEREEARRALDRFAEANRYIVI